MHLVYNQNRLFRTAYGLWVETATVHMYSSTHHCDVFFISHDVTSLVLCFYISNNVVAEVTSHNISQWDILGPNSFVFRI